MHHESELTLLGLRQLTVRRVLRGEIGEEIPGRRLHRGDRMVELLDRRKVAVLDARGVEQHRERRDSEFAQRGDQEGRLVLAVAETGLEYLVRRARLVADHTKSGGHVARAL